MRMIKDSSTKNSKIQDAKINNLEAGNVEFQDLEVQNITTSSITLESPSSGTFEAQFTYNSIVQDTTTFTYKIIDDLVFLSLDRMINGSSDTSRYTLPSGSLPSIIRPLYEADCVFASASDSPAIIKFFKIFPNGDMESSEFDSSENKNWSNITLVYNKTVF